MRLTLPQLTSREVQLNLRTLNSIWGHSLESVRLCALLRFADRSESVPRIHVYLVGSANVALLHPDAEPSPCVALVASCRIPDVREAPHTASLT